VQDLARASGVSGSAIKRMEEFDGIPRSLAENLSKIKTSLEGKGIDFIDNGIYCKKSPHN
jgi:hypothetical protein